MTMLRYYPWSLFNQVQRDMAHVYDGAERKRASDQTVQSDWTPAVDIREESDRYVILADIPGVDPHSIDIQTEKDVLTINGERSDVNDRERDQYKRRERVRGVFVRRFTLPDAADTEHISARSSNGVLEVIIPKAATVQPRKIVVNG